MKKILFVILPAFLMPSVFSQSNFENRKKEGYYNITQISLLMGNRKLSEPSNYYYNTRNNMLVSPSVTMTNGYKFNEHWAAGIGVGFELFDHNHFPVFAEIRYVLWDNAVSPFFAIKMGHAIGNLNKKHYDELYLNYSPFNVNNACFRNYGGLMLHPEMGVKIPLSKNADWLFTVAYRYQKSKTTVSQDFGQRNEWEHKSDLNRLVFGAAIMFR